MRRKPELLVLAGLLLAAGAFVLWYVADRRAKLRASPMTSSAASHLPGPAVGPFSPAATPPSATAVPAAPVAATTPSTAAPSREPVDLTKHDQQTIDFSSGKPVAKNAAEDKAAIEAAMKDIKSAEEETTFEAPKKKDAPPGK